MSESEREREREIENVLFIYLERKKRFHILSLALSHSTQFNSAKAFVVVVVLYCDNNIHIFFVLGSFCQSEMPKLSGFVHARFKLVFYDLNRNAL